MATISRRTRRTRIGLRNGWLRQVEGAPETATGTTTDAGAADGTTLVDTALYSSARDQFVRQGDIVCITEQGATTNHRGQRSVATGPPSPSGVVTVSPAFSPAAAVDSGVDYEIWDADGPHPDVIDRMGDRALQEDCWRWQPMPITFVPGGDVGEELSISGGNVMDGSTAVWTATNATPTLPALSPPDEFVRRVIRVTASAAGGYLESQALDVDVDDRSSWWIHALVRAGPGADAGRIVLRDLTNSADITPDKALTRSREAWGLIEGGFTIPSDCEQIAIRLQCDANGDIMDFAWIQAWPIGQQRFSLPQRIVSSAHVGSVFRRLGTLFGEFTRAPWTGALERRDVAGTGVSLFLNPAPGSASIWFYEKASYPALTSATPAAADDDNTTWAAPDWVIAATEYELYKYLQRRDWKEAPGRWDDRLSQALLDLSVMQREFGADPLYVPDRVTPQYRAVQRV